MATTRRGFLRLPVACAACAAAASAASAQGGGAGGHAEWGYVGPTGPEHWAELGAQYRVCATGTQESPVDLRGAVPAALGEVEVRYGAMPLRVENNGHTVQVAAAPGNTLRFGGVEHELAQFHFHHPSEHLLEGRRFPMEAHFVHRGPDGTLAVLAVFVAAGARNAALAPVFDNLPPQRAAARAPAGAAVRPADMLPADRRFLRYNGSLTTPPCTENVAWVVLRAPVEASREQLDRFAALFPMNARPLQALNRRFLLESPK